MNRKAIIRLTLATALTMAFAAWLLRMFDLALFAAWDPSIPGCEEYYSWNGYSVALWFLFINLGWVTIPATVLTVIAWATGFRALRETKTTNQKVDNIPKGSNTSLREIVT